MAKRDRIPHAWPLIMSDAMAAAFLDMSVSQFRARVECGKLPKGRKVFDTELVRWRREDLENATALEFGLPARNIRLPAVDGNEWLEAVRAN
jgi:hypothetical protein